MKLPVVAPRSKKEIERDVIRLLSDIQAEALCSDDCPVDAEYIYEYYIREKYGLVTDYIDLSVIGPNILGYTDANSNSSYVDKALVDSNSQSTLRRLRATVAHEIGHCIYHVPELKNFRSSLSVTGGILFREEPSNIKAYENPEWQAWQFAGSLLMPEKKIISYYEKGCSTDVIANIFDVNPSFVKVRLNKLGIKTNPL
ncbi:ImmA/IrrE family metallo-endopeptidase [Desulforegula conservatrix]|uniref:ImmA/IrrE family metallo-endopeptidase n=1 Tax=Desulforegula conservatrix TaxID=153026 RepID=UPI000409E7F2|nr:ImmA/IrrE family metallo-endopeptidase [Desulforegula conservatrix]